MKIRVEAIHVWCIDIDITFDALSELKALARVAPNLMIEGTTTDGRIIHRHSFPISKLDLSTESIVALNEDDLPRLLPLPRPSWDVPVDKAQLASLDRLDRPGLPDRPHGWDSEGTAIP